jgi:hypothetical protein
MKKWLINIIFQIVSLPAIFQATGMADPDSLSDGDILQALLLAFAPIETENYWRIILFSSLAIFFLS